MFMGDQKGRPVGSMSIRLLIADDHQLFRTGLAQLCEINGGFYVVDQATDGEEAVALAKRHQPDLILMDIQMPNMTGIEATAAILRDNPAARILILTMYKQDMQVLASLQAGAAGYILKTADEQSLFNAIRIIHNGGGWLDPSITPAILSQLHGNKPTLSQNEIALLRLVAQGANNQSIADELHLSVGTVGNRLRVIFNKLNVQNRTEAALYALRYGWATLH